ncbi:response regulator [Dactylosporangium aurantiacum]|uniref:response regulator n=1 Tax=Dactylosporangium aurantiacum TaxID=35754 RepID=UPI001FE05E2C|nr:response regulator [Dactylosporangium aurantiacum]MDG6104935.1 response regulator [Dactylosporangium aurantiacum]
MKPLSHRVLLVEDNPDDLELARLAFERGGFARNVDVARDGAEALDHLFGPAAPAPPQVVLLDIKLPLVDGIDVLRRIKADPRTRHIPVVMLTSSAQDRDLHACYDLGANSYIVKPVDMEQFMSAVNSIGLYWLGLNLTDAHS